MAQTSHDQKALAETEWNLAMITAVIWGDPISALLRGEYALELAHASNDWVQIIRGCVKRPEKPFPIVGFPLAS
jgi:hypothetical protein